MTAPVGPFRNSVVSGFDASVAAQTLLEERDSRRGFRVYNNSAATLYMKNGAGAAIAKGGFTVSIPPYGYYEEPFIGIVHASGEVSGGVYSGVVTAVSSSATGYINVTEVY